jgi:DNA (cytosine-5)-methyltransferase 1
LQPLSCLRTSTAYPVSKEKAGKSLFSVNSSAKMARKFPEVMMHASPTVVPGFSDLRQQAGISIDELSGQSGFSVRQLYRYERGESLPRKAVIHFLQEMIRKTRPPAPEKPSFTFIDLFAGIGGLRRGFEPLGGRCVFTSEWDEYAQKTYLANFSCDHPVKGDITKIEASEIPPHDVLLAGFPCQPFSIAGVSKKNALNRPHGFSCEMQGTLFFDVARIIKHHQPKVFVLENVKNLVNHDKGRTFEVIHRTLKEDLGYQVQWKVVNAKSWAPQHRERIFIVGFRETNDFIFEDMVIPDPQRGPKLESILHKEDGSEAEEKPYTEGSPARVSDKYTLSTHLWTYLRDYAEKHRAKGNGFGFGLFGPDDVARTLSARYYKDGSEILIRRGRGNPRRLTPRECARLMGFDRAGQNSFVIPVSDTRAYKQFGNAVVVPVVEAIARHIGPWIGAGAETDIKQLRLRLG